MGSAFSTSRPYYTSARGTPFEISTRAAAAAAAAAVAGPQVSRFGLAARWFGLAARWFGLAARC